MQGHPLRLFFHLLYHPFAFAYDFVAATVSRGRWQDWVLEVVPFLEGTRTLELGHGPGHLHRFLLNRGLTAVAIDESAPMGSLARGNLLASQGKSPGASSAPTPQSGYAQINLTRGLAQALPFHNGAFDTVLATFPAEYITDPRTLSEVRRCLSDGGRLVVLPAAMPKHRLLAWLFRVTGQASDDAAQTVQQKLKEPFAASGFDVESHILERDSGTLIVLVATARTAEAGDGRVE